MEFVAKLDDQISSPSAAAAGAQDALAAATKGADAALKALDVSQAKAARRAALTAKAFNPKAYQQQIVAQEQLKKSQERALQELGLGLSKKEQEEKASKKAAADEKTRLRELATARASSGLSSLASLAKKAAISFAALTIAAGGLSFATIAVGYQTMWKLQTITAQNAIRFRQLFRGIDSTPLVRAYQRISGFLDKNTVAGGALSGLLVRGFNNFFRLVERAEPFVEAFGKGILLAALRGENAWLRARVALFPYTNAISKATGKIEIMNLVSYGTAAAVTALGARLAFTAALSVGKFAFGMALGAARMVMMGITAILTAGKVGALGLAATGAAAPFLALAAAIGAVVAAGYQFSKLMDEWDTDVLLRAIGAKESTTAGYQRMLDAEEAARKKAGKKSMVREGSLPTNDGTAAAMKSGQAIGDGLIAGMKSKEAEVKAAGGALAKSADAGVRAAAEIHSPSRLMKREAHQMGEGAVGGLRESAPRVQRAAQESLVPDVSKPAREPLVPVAAMGRSGAAGAPTGAPAESSGSSRPIHASVSIGELIIGDARSSRAKLRAAVDAVAEEIWAQVEIGLGGQLEGVGGQLEGVG